MKNPVDLPKGRLKQLLEATPTPVDEGTETQRLDAPHEQAGKALYKEFKLDKLKTAVKKRELRGANTMIVRARATSQAALTRTLVSWFQFPSLEDIHPTFPDQEPKKYDVFDSVMHRRLVLVVTVSAALWKKLQPKLIYWGLRRNILLTNEDFDSKQLARDWSNFFREEKGPLSRMRHDLKSHWSREELRGELEEAVKTLNQAELLLMLADSDCQKLDKSLKTGGEVAQEVVAGLLKPSADDTNLMHKEVRTLIWEITKKVGATESTLATTNRDRQLAGLVQKFVVGDR